ncbi:MAG: lamin tail domain-containing protein [Candidatus Moraniibacteriota bacterium]
MPLFPNPKGNDTGQEWIEIKNASGKTIDLKNWVIATGSSKEKLVNHPLRESLKLKKGALLRLTRKHASITLTNSIGIVQLLAPDKKKVDEVRYATPTGKSIPQEALYQRDTSGAWVWKFVSATSIPLNTVKDTIAKGPLTPLTTPWPIFQGLRQEKDTSLAKKQSLGSLALGTRLSLPVDMPYIPIQQYQKSLSSGEALEWPGVRVLNTRINLWLAGLQTL